MAWTNYKFYRDIFLMGDAPRIPEQSFKRWENNAVIALNRRNIEFADIDDYETLQKAYETLINLGDVGSDDLQDIENFINSQLKGATAIIDEYLEITANTLTDIYDFEIEEDNGEYHLINIVLVSEPHVPPPEIIQKMVCEYAESMMFYNENTSGTEGLKGETNLNYSWTGASSKDDKAAYTQRLMNIVAKYTAHNMWREWFYEPYVGLI